MTDVLLEKFKRKILDILIVNSAEFLFKTSKLSKDRIYAISNGQIPTLDELERLVALADIEFLDILCQLCEKSYPKEAEIETIYYRTLFLSNHIRQKKEEFRYDWADIKDKFGFNKQDEYRMRNRNNGKTSVAVLKKLVGFCDPVVLNYIRTSFHGLDIPSPEVVNDIATADDFNKSVDNLSIDEQKKISKHIVQKLSPDELLAHLSDIFIDRVNVTNVTNVDADNDEFLA